LVSDDSAKLPIVAKAAMAKTIIRTAAVIRELLGLAGKFGDHPLLKRLACRPREARCIL
jgi:hypothetical protein